MSRLLVIDDEPSSRLILQNRLKDAGYDVTVAESGAQGLHDARARGFDVILVDDGLGSGIDANEVCRRLKQSAEAGKVPVVLVSKQAAQREALQRGYAAGCDRYVCKHDLPVLEDVLLAILRQKQLVEDIVSQLRATEDQLRRAKDAEKQTSEIESGRNGGSSDPSLVFKELASGLPDGLLIVDAEGVVLMADRGAHEYLGNRIEGDQLGRLARGTGLEAFVRDAHTEKREGFRFDLPVAGRGKRTMHAAVVPLVACPGEDDPGLRAVLLLDLARRRVASELMRLQEQGTPRREIAVMAEIARSSFSPSSLVGSSPDIAQLRSLVSSAAVSPKPVIVIGEEGVGKQHVARVLHYASRATGPIVPVHCGALTAVALQAELFGLAKSDSVLFDQPGAFQTAHHGSLLLENLDRMPVELQPKLLEVVKTGKVRRVGGKKAERVQTRLLVTTTVDLEQEVAAGRFDAELYAALNDFEIEIPPLRERVEDVVVLAQHFLERFGAAHEVLEISEEALAAMQDYAWPENVRELASCIERACMSCSNGEITIDDLSEPLRESARQLDKQIVPSQPRVAIGGTHTAGTGRAGSNHHGRPQREYDITDDDPPSFAIYERKCLLRTLEMTGGDKLKAAKLLNVGKSTLYRKLKRHDIH